MNAIAGFLSRSCHVLTIEELAREAIGTQKSHKHWVYMVGATGIEPVTPSRGYTISTIYALRSRVYVTEDDSNRLE